MHEKNQFQKKVKGGILKCSTGIGLKVCAHVGRNSKRGYICNFCAFFHIIKSTLDEFPSHKNIDSKSIFRDIM